jgi:uncharacterized protein (DUF3084 family)
MAYQPHEQPRQRQEKTNEQLQAPHTAMGEEMKAWLESRPELMRRLEEMKRICQNEQARHKLLGQAESALAEQLDASGRDLISAWLEQRNQQESARASAKTDLRKHAKKNCASRHSSVPWKRKSN